MQMLFFVFRTSQLDCFFIFDLSFCIFIFNFCISTLEPLAMAQGKLRKGSIRFLLRWSPSSPSPLMGEGWGEGEKACEIASLRSQ